MTLQPTARRMPHTEKERHPNVKVQEILYMTFPERSLAISEVLMINLYLDKVFNPQQQITNMREENRNSQTNSVRVAQRCSALRLKFLKVHELEISHGAKVGSPQLLQLSVVLLIREVQLTQVDVIAHFTAICHRQRAANISVSIIGDWG